MPPPPRRGQKVGRRAPACQESDPLFRYLIPPPFPSLSVQSSKYIYIGRLPEGRREQSVSYTGLPSFPLATAETKGMSEQAPSHRPNERGVGLPNGDRRASANFIHEKFVRKFCQLSRDAFANSVQRSDSFGLNLPSFVACTRPQGPN